MNVKHPKHLFSEDLEIHIIEIPKWEANEERFNDIDPLSAWLAYLSAKTSNEKRKEILMQNNNLQSLTQVEQNFISSPKLITAYDQQEKYYRDMLSLEDSIRKEAWEKGIDEGEIKGTILTIKDLKMSSDDAIKNIMRRYNMDIEDAKKCVERYW